MFREYGIFKHLLRFRMLIIIVGSGSYKWYIDFGTKACSLLKFAPKDPLDRLVSDWLISLWSSVQSLSHVQLFVTPWTAACQASLFFTNYWSLLRLMSIESMKPSNHLSHFHPLLLPPSMFPSIRVFSNDSVLQIRRSKYWSFSFSISPSNEYSGIILFRID